MQRKNNLSKNLKTLQKVRHITQAEFARELDMPKSTLQTVMMDGNTSLDTLIHIANALNISLDELVFGERPSEREWLIGALFNCIGWFAGQSAERQKKLHYHIDGLMNLLTREEVLAFMDTVDDVRRKLNGDI